MPWRCCCGPPVPREAKREVLRRTQATPVLPGHGTQSHHPVEIDTMRRRAWHEQGVAALPVADITDPWLRQAIQNEAVRRWGPRPQEKTHGR